MASKLEEKASQYGIETQDIAKDYSSLMDTKKGIRQTQNEGLFIFIEVILKFQMLN